MTVLAGRPVTFRAVLAHVTDTLAAAGIDGARRDARLLVDHALGVPGASRVRRPDEPLGPAALARLDALLRRRAAREPMARILGVREFWSLEFKVSPDTLVPRPDSELAVELALRHLSGRGIDTARVLDLGTGSGCLLLAVLHDRPDAAGVGVDISPAALAVAAENARALGLDGRAGFVAGDWTAPVSGTFDVILANPPYVADAEWAVLEPEVRDHEPAIALAGGADGLDCHRRLAAALGPLLAPGGAAILECGAGQATAVAALLRHGGFGRTEAARDLGSVERCVLATV